MYKKDVFCISYIVCCKTKGLTMLIWVEQVDLSIDARDYNIASYQDYLGMFSNCCGK